MQDQKPFRLVLKGKTAIFIDWANVYGWRGYSVDPKRLYRYLKTYREVSDIHFYFGLDTHPKSKTFLEAMKRTGFTVITKEVKYIPVSLDTSHFKKTIKEIKESLAEMQGIAIKDLEKLLSLLDRKIMRRKCDFDIEIAISFQAMEISHRFLIF